MHMTIMRWHKLSCPVGENGSKYGRLDLVMSTQIILASQSPQRRNLLASLGLKFEVIPAAIDEQAIQHADPVIRAQLVASAKAEKIAAQFPQAIVIAGDSFIVCHGQTLEKPQSSQEAKHMLQTQSGQWIEEFAGVCYLDPTTSVKLVETGRGRALFRSLSQSEIDYYVANNPVTTWSAGFSAAYDAGMALFERLEGSLTAFTHGLAIEVVTAGLRRSGVLPAV